MILSAVLVASLQIYGTDVPDHFRRGEVSAYVGCLRAEVNDANSPWDGPDPVAPTVVQFGQVMSYCSPERTRAISALRGFIQTRHPDWPSERVGDSAEFVLTGLELEQMTSRRWPQCSLHEMPCEEF
ncbi:MAG TPA: hypothetical protein VF603_09295 [Allosphingosinicella sp.]|jgi:hypothetical protein